jgi:hypothetical protein
VCSTGYAYLPANDAFLNPTDTACCHQMTCTNIDGSHTDYRCPSGATAGYVTLTNDAIANDANCCHEKMCTDVDGTGGDYVCPDGYTYVSANDNNKPPGYSSCCAVCACTCSNGTPTTAMGTAGTLCDTDGQEDCSACAGGYHLSGTAAEGTATTCAGETPSRFDPSRRI